ncbi:hypothetical protein ISCGN_026033 [Ixodes scapularis]
MALSYTVISRRQVEHRCEQRDRVTQTDVYVPGTDDLDLSLGEEDDEDEGLGDRGELSSASHEAVQPDPLLVTSSGAEPNGASEMNSHDAKRRMLEDAEQRIMLLTKKIHLDIDMTPRSVATSEIGVQAGCGRSSRWTQTERAGTAPASGPGARSGGGASLHRPMGLPPDVSEPDLGALLSRMPTSDIESQTDPVTRAPAANAAPGNEHHEEFSDDELTSPMTHIGKNLAEEGRLSDSIAQILDDMDSEPRPRTRLRTRTRRTSSKVPRRETGVQTVNDLVTDEAPEFAARPPPCKKREMIPSMAVFQDVDRIALQYTQLEPLVSGAPYVAATDSARSTSHCWPVAVSSVSRSSQEEGHVGETTFHGSVDQPEITVHDDRDPPACILRTSVRKEGTNGTAAFSIRASEVARAMVTPGRVTGRMHMAGSRSHNEFGASSGGETRSARGSRTGWETKGGKETLPLSRRAQAHQLGSLMRFYKFLQGVGHTKPL